MNKTTYTIITVIELIAMLIAMVLIIGIFLMIAGGSFWG